MKKKLSLSPAELEVIEKECREALADPAEIRIVVKGRNGHKVRHVYPVHETEDATTSVDYETEYPEPEGWGAGAYRRVAGPPFRRRLKLDVLFERRAW